jgi:hypothetical protein
MSGNNAVRVFTIQVGAVMTLNQMSIISGKAAGNSGGGIYSNGTLTVSNSTLSANSAGDGGGIFNNGGTLTVSNSTFSANSASNYGGGIRNEGGTTTVTNSTLSGNSANLGGATQTFALLPGSPAIDAGDSASCASAPISSLDQRGITRPASCDIGAFESRGFSLGSLKRGTAEC